LGKKRKAQAKSERPQIKNSKWQKIEPVTRNQQHLVKSINENAISFITGPAGTGKTFLSLASAVKLVKEKKYKRIMITRPQVATKKMPFLPGTEAEKNAPFIRPIRDALSKILSPSEIDKMLNMKIIEGITLEYMRGMSIDNTIVILDEAQNVEEKEILMFLTRIGQNSKFIVTGDIYQTDLKENSGLAIASAILESIPGIGIVELDLDDIVRNPLVKSIVQRFAMFSETKRNSNTRGNDTEFEAPDYLSAVLNDSEFFDDYD